MQKVYAMEQFHINKIYRRLLSVFPEVTRTRLVCNNSGVPKWIFISKLALLSMLYTKGMLAKWGILVDRDCVLCDNRSKTASHLFF